MRRKIFQVIRGSNPEQPLSFYFDYFITGLIIANVVAIVLESYEGILNQYERFFFIFELVSVVIFSIEYLLRVATADLLYPDKSKPKAVLKFIFSPFGLIDLLAILPFYLPFIMTIDLRFIRAMRLVRLLRILKLSRYMKSMQLIGRVLKDTAADLAITVLVCVILIVIASTLMFNLERDAQPEQFKNIGNAFWWAIATLTTVGYGDIYPVTGWGKLVSGIIAVLGIGLIALPTGIISSSFMEEMRKERERKRIAKIEAETGGKVCPHCGKPI
ncbi:MAG: ion transporter [Chitinophagales bacterium]|nr:ion transporter [Chitinophagales bacterium]